MADACLIVGNIMEDSGTSLRVRLCEKAPAPRTVQVVLINREADFEPCRKPNRHGMLLTPLHPCAFYLNVRVRALACGLVSSACLLTSTRAWREEVPGRLNVGGTV